MKRLTAGIVLLTCLACGGLGADEVHEAVMASCDSDVYVPHGVELVRLDASLPAPKIAVSLALANDHWLLDGDWLDPDPAALRDRLREKAETAKLLAERTGSDAFAFNGTLLLLVPPETPGATVLSVLEAARDTEFPKVRFVVRTGDKPAPSYLDPDYGAELQARVSAMDPAERAMNIAMEMEGLLVACPPGQEAFAAVANASAEMKCTLMAHGLAEALPMCPLTNDKKVVTLMQVVSMSSPYEHGMLSLTLDPEATVHPVDPAAPWSTLAPWWAGQDTDAPAWWVAATDAG